MSFVKIQQFKDNFNSYCAHSHIAGNKLTAIQCITVKLHQCCFVMSIQWMDDWKKLIKTHMDCVTEVQFAGFFVNDMHTIFMWRHMKETQMLSFSVWPPNKAFLIDWWFVSNPSDCTAHVSCLIVVMSTILSKNFVQIHQNKLHVMINQNTPSALLHTVSFWNSYQR